MSAISDAGQELVHNRRNKDHGITWLDVSALPDALRAASITKESVWPRPDYQALVASGLQPVSVRLLKHVYDGIAAKPKQLNDEALQGYVYAVERVRDAMLPWVRDLAAFREVADNTIGKLKSSMDAAAASQQAMNGQAIDVLSLIERPASSGATINDVFLRLLWPDEMGKARRDRFARGSNALREVSLLGGNRFFSHIQLSAKDLADFSVEVREGWPAKRAAWQTQGMRVISDHTVVVQAVGHEHPGWSVFVDAGPRSHIYIGVFDNEPQAQGAASQIKPHILVTKSGRMLSSHNTEAEAIAAAVDQAAAGKRSKLWAPEPIAVDKLKRQGPRRRDGDVSSAQLMDQCALKGVNFGNWVPQGERQRLLNACFDSAVDLAHALSMPVSDIGRDGSLGLAIGAQGTGKAGGHFFPGANEINATRFSGGGVMSHEYGHFLDHVCAGILTDARGERAYLSALLDGANPKVAAELRAANPERRELIDAFEGVMAALTYKPKQHEQAVAEAEARATRYRRNAMTWIEGFNLEQASTSPDVVAALQAQAGALLEAGVSLDMPHRSLGKSKSMDGFVAEPVCDLYDAMKASGMRMPPVSSFAAIEANLLQVRSNSPGGRSYPKVGEPAAKTLTDFVKQSELMDREKGGERYWSLSCELFARAFASWVRVRLERDNIINEHLACDDHAHYQAAVEMGFVKANPFLTGDELARVVAAMDKLVEVLPVNKVIALVAAAPEANATSKQVKDALVRPPPTEQADLFGAPPPSPCTKRQRGR